MNMVKRSGRIIFILPLLGFLLMGSTSIPAEMISQSDLSGPIVSSHAIILEGIRQIKVNQDLIHSPSNRLETLEQWYNQHSLVEYASLLGSSITVRFIDGSLIVLLNPFVEPQESLGEFINPFLHERYGNNASHTAIILNPAESMYGHRQCQKIIMTLVRQDFSIEYLANQAVDLPYIKNNLSASIIYMNTHAGYLDIDGDHQADAVVIATGERWTNETELKYAYEYQNHLIVKGMVGNKEYVAFTPAFIEHYYDQGRFPESLIFMATCSALYDASMGQAFLDSGARVYMGWSASTTFWTNGRTSVQVFHLLSYGLTIHQICNLIRSGGFYNWLFHSKLLYLGDGTYRLP